MVAAAQKLTDLSNAERPTFGTNIYEDTGFEQTFLVNFGVEDGIYAKDGKRWTMATPKGIEAMQAIIDLHCRSRCSAPSTTARGLGGDRQHAVHPGPAGDALRHHDRHAQLPWDIRDFDWDIAPVPKKERRVTEGSLICYCVPKEAKSPDGAWQVLQHMTAERAGASSPSSSTTSPPARRRASSWWRSRARSRSGSGSSWRR